MGEPDQKSVNPYEQFGHSQDYKGKIIIVGALYTDSSNSQVCQVRFASPKLIKVDYEDGGVKQTDTSTDIREITNNLILLRDGPAECKIDRYRSRANWISAQLRSPSHKKVLETITRVGI